MAFFGLFYNISSYYQSRLNKLVLVVTKPSGAHLSCGRWKGKGKRFLELLVVGWVSRGCLPLGFPKQLKGTEPDSGVSLFSFNGFIIHMKVKNGE